jgi:hypothetical protein
MAKLNMVPEKAKTIIVPTPADAGNPVDVKKSEAHPSSPPASTTVHQK